MNRKKNTSTLKKMTGLELNRKIKDICKYDSSVEFNAFGGKPIPYIGWFWRSINFDKFDRRFGIIPANENPDNKKLVGFMPRDKWGYASVEATEEEWNNIRKLLELAAINPIESNLKAVNDAIQDLLNAKTFLSIE